MRIDCGFVSGNCGCCGAVVFLSIERSLQASDITDRMSVRPGAAHEVTDVRNNMKVSEFRLAIERGL